MLRRWEGALLGCRVCGCMRCKVCCVATFVGVGGYVLVNVVVGLGYP